MSLTLDGPFGHQLSADADNLVLAAARALQSAADVKHGANLHLTKNLPIASGIGGGSADAAAALRLLARLWGVSPEVDLLAIAASLGADVPACLGSRTIFGSSVGERLQTVDVAVTGRAVLLVNPLKSCPTGPVFRAWDGVDRGALVPQNWAEGRNDLQAPAVALVPEIAEVLAALSALPDSRLVRMSGSGATCFALFDDAPARDRADAAIRAAHPGWWTMASVLQ